jgi:apolipoprotein N-acyltransferase
VPFGEFVPLRKYLPFLRYYCVRSQDTSPGKEYKVLDAGRYQVGAAICFESAFPSILRHMTASGANLLCVITDDEWFARTATSEQHLSKSVLRAVENGRYLLRGAATGTSSIIDPKGRVLDRTELFDSGVLVRDVWTQDGLTMYARFGDWIVYGSMLFCLFIAARLVIRRSSGLRRHGK